MAAAPGVMFSTARFSDEYKLGAKLGEGHFGVVREVVEKSSGKKYACKIILKKASSEVGADSDRARSRLRWEAELSLELSRECTGLVRTIQAFEDEQRVYLVMELCRGGTLAEYIERRRDAWAREVNRALESGMMFVEIEEVKRKRRERVEIEAGWILGELASALAQCHEHDVIHRDMKPENVMLSSAVGEGRWASGLPAAVLTERAEGRKVRRSSGSLWRKVYNAVKCTRVGPEEKGQDVDNNTTQSSGVKIADFGLAERITPGGTAQRGIVGSPAYVAPELVLSQPVGFPADIWGLGIILFFLLSEGRLPFTGRSTAMLFRNIRKASIDLNSPALVGASAAAKEVLQRLLSAEPGSRPTAAEVLALPWVQEQIQRREAMIKSSH